MAQEKIKVLIFDMEGVVVTPWHAFSKFLPDTKDLSEAELLKIWNDPLIVESNPQFNYGRMSEDDFIKFVKKAFVTSATKADIKMAINTAVVETPGIRYLISELRKKYKVALLTNFSKEWFEEYNTRFGFRKLFDSVFVSGYTGIRKPDVKAYVQVSEAFHVEPEECLFIDDDEIKIEGAKKAGMSTVKFVDVVQLNNHLKKELKIEFPEPLHIFRSYDIRGIYGLDLNDEIGANIGKSLGTYIGAGKSFILAIDYRKSSPNLHDALLSGVLSVGTNVIDIGILPTPIFYFSIVHKETNGGVMITASHNPPMWNGFKMCREGAEMIAEDHGIEKVKEIFAKKKFEESDSKGTTTKYSRAVEDYTNHVLRNIKLKRGLRVVLDPGNGTWCGIAKDIFEKLGCEVIEINGKPDSNFSSRGPDPNDFALAGLKKRVVEVSADFGAGFDTDGDRAGMVNEKGEYVGTSDMLLPLYASYLLENKMKGAKVVYDTPCSTVIEEVINKLGATPLMNRTGHSHMMTRMMNEKAILGGEYSNHIYFPENFNLDDGCYAASKMAELLSQHSEPLSKLMSSIPHYPAVPIKEIYCPDEFKFEVVKSVKKRFESSDFQKIIDIDGAKAFTKRGWVLVRASNTMPQVKVNSEGKTKEDAAELFDMASRIVIDEIAKRMV